MSADVTSAVGIGRRYQLHAPEGVGIGFATLMPGDCVQVYDIAPPGQHLNPLPDENYISFVFQDTRVVPGETIERRIAYGEKDFLKAFVLIDDSTATVGQPPSTGQQADA